MATPSLPVPVEVLETVLRFVPVNENFRIDQPTNQNATSESRDKAFSSLRVNKFWRLQFAYKQWMEIVQLHLGQFELKMSATCDPDQEIKEDEAPIIWNEFVAFNLNKEIGGVKGLNHLSSSYLNCYVASVKLFYAVPASIGTALCKVRLASTLKQISAFFADQPLRLDLRLRILEVEADGIPRFQVPHFQAFPVPPGPTAIEIPPNITLANLSVIGIGPYIGLLQSLLLAGQGSLKSLSADVLVLLPSLNALSTLILPGVASLKLLAINQGVAPGGYGQVPADPLATLANAFPNLATLQLPPPDSPFQDLGHGMPPGLQGAMGRGRGGGMAAIRAAQLHQQQIQQMFAQAPGPAAGPRPRAHAPIPGGMGMLIPGPLGGPVVGLPGVPGAPAGMPAVVDLRPLTLLPALTSLEFAWPSQTAQSILPIEHEYINSLHMRVGQGIGATAFDAAGCNMWLKVAKVLESLEFSGLSHHQLWLFASQLDGLSAVLNFSRLKTVRLGIEKQDGSDDDMYTGSGIAAAFTKFNLHFTALQSITLKLKATEVPDNFSRFVLENVPEQTRHLKLVNIFQNKTPPKQWKTWIFNVIANVASSLPRADHVEIECSPECFSMRYEGLAVTCQELAEDSRRLAFNYGAYVTVLDSIRVRRLRVSKQTTIADSHASSTKANYALQFFLKKPTGNSAAQNKSEEEEQQISFLFKDVQPFKFNPHPADHL